MAGSPLMVGVSLGGSVPQGVPPPATLMAAARHAEAAGYDALWCGDHVMMYSPMIEPTTLLSCFAGITERVRLGTAVYLLPLRHPVTTAKLFAGLDYVSGGRLIFGVGVGGEIPSEFEACGVPVGERGGRTDEGLEIVRRLWSETGVSFDGRYYRFRDVTLAPPPTQRPHPPIWLGGQRRRGIELAARYGDGWAMPGDRAGDVGYFSERRDEIRRALDAAGRDPRGFALAGQVVGAAAADAEGRRSRREALETARAFVRAGADHVIVGIAPAAGPSALALAAREIAEPLRSEAG